MISYKDKKIWLIGASSGIGKALAIKLSNSGAILFLSARRQNELNNLNKLLDNKHYVVPFDVSDHVAFEKAAKDIFENTHDINSVIYMAGIYTPSNLDQMDIKKAHAIIDVNFKGAINLLYVILPYLKKSKKSQIALCGSVAGFRGLPGGQPYCASKAAIISLTESLYIECPHLDIKLINPGFVQTDMTSKNNFNMPMIVDVEKAAQEIFNKLQSNNFEIHFPKKFTFIMKFLKIIPSDIYLYIIKILNKKINRTCE